MESTHIPTAKVEKVEQFGGFAYANEDFSSFVERQDDIFRSTLTPEYLMMNGSCLIFLIYDWLNTGEGLLNKISVFLGDNITLL